VVTARTRAVLLAREALHRAGVDLIRWPRWEPYFQTAQQLDRHDVGCVVDVGANDGGFATSLRRFGYSGRILSFEPVPEVFGALAARTSGDPAWTPLQLALGDREDVVTINVAGNAGASSSMLPMLDRHTAAAPQAAYVRSEQVRQVRLDDVPEVSQLVDDGTPFFLKIDVQGYERAVLDGAPRVLGARSLVGLQLELSLTPLYEGAMTWREGFDLVDDIGLAPTALHPAFTDPRSGELLQVDGVFFRRSAP
jgi:FkbM family methyltransferase